MKKYIYQKFLLNCDYRGICLSEIPQYNADLRSVLEYGMEYCILDYGREIVRKININSLNCMIDTEMDWNEFMDSINWVDSIVLYSSQGGIDNPIIREYWKVCLQAFVYRLKQSNSKIKVYYNGENDF